MNNKKKLKQFMICLCCVFCSTALTIPYLSYATTQDDLDNANRELESLKAQQQSLSAVYPKLTVSSRTPEAVYLP